MGNFEKIMQEWEGFFKQSANMIKEGQEKFFYSSKNLLEALQYFSEMVGNIPMSSFYQNMSEQLQKIKEQVIKD